MAHFHQQQAQELQMQLLDNTWEQSDDCNLWLLQMSAIFKQLQSRQVLESWVYGSASVVFIPSLKNFSVFDIYIFLHTHIYSYTKLFLNIIQCKLYNVNLCHQRLLSHHQHKLIKLILNKKHQTKDSYRSQENKNM